MGSQSENMIHAVVFKNGSNWVAQCLEHDIATQAASVDALIYELQRIVVAHLLVEDKEHRFKDVPQAPKRFWEMYRRARSRVRTIPAEELPVPDKKPRPTFEVAFTEPVAA